MSLESFYGGKQGISPVIRGSFKYVTSKIENGSYVDPAYGARIGTKSSLTKKEANRLNLSFGTTYAAGDKVTWTKKLLTPFTMDDQLSDSSYEDIWYNELCIIDTGNKNNPNNGKLYRRTLKGRGDSDLKNRSAEYIGQIVGPAGTNPFMAFKSLEGVKDKVNESSIANEDTFINWPDGEDSTSILKPENGNKISPHIFNASVNNNMIIPGKVHSEDGDVYNDNIRYTWVNIVDNTTGDNTRSMVYLGFEIPYPSIDITTTAVDWDKEVSSTKRTGEGYDEHPFYHSWKINIPRGIRGNAASNIRLARCKDFSNLSGDTSKPFLYDFKNGVVENNTQRGSFTVKKETPSIFENWTDEEKDLYKDALIWVYDYTFYDKAQNKKATINGAKIDSSERPVYTFYLGSHKEISDITFDEHGVITFIYSDTTKTELSQAVQWVKEISITNSGIITFTYNTLNKNNKNITYTKQLPFPDKLTISKEGEITAFFKDGTSLSLDTTWDNQDPFDLNYVKKLSIDDDTKVLSYTTYPKNNGGVLNKGEGINYIQAMTIDEKNHLLVYYASSQFRPTQKDVDDKKANPNIENGITLIENKENNVNYVIWKGQTFRDGIAYGDNDHDDDDDDIPQSEYWQDFGVMRQIEKGVRIWAEFDLTSHPNHSSITSYTHERFIEDVLNASSWGNKPNPYYGGKIGDAKDENGNPLTGAFCYTTEIEDGSAYYYDRDAQRWAYAGSWAASDITDVKINTLPLDNQKFSDTGIVFIERTTQQKDNSLPALYW